MSKNIIQSIVIILGILIILAFLALIYGMYQKISTSGKEYSTKTYQNIFSANLAKNEKYKEY